MEATIRKIGNSQGVLIPEPILDQVGLDGRAGLRVLDGVIEILPLRTNPREGWSDDARHIACEPGDALAWPEFADEDDAELKW
jgi:antitoxin MazE